MPELLLYTTAGCHLCDSAKDALWPALSAFSLTLREVEIAERGELMERYGMRIPVIALGEHGPELDFPFTPEQVTQWLGET